MNAATTTLPYSVFCWKSNNTLVRFQSYATRTEAQEVIEALARVGCSATVIVDDSAQGGADITKAPQ